MRPSLIRVLLLPMVGVLFIGRVEADPTIAFSNIPPPSEYKVGGSTVTDGNLKALLFTTPSSSRVVLTSVKVGLTYCNNSDCAGRSTVPVDVYPSQADFQVSIYSVRDQGGVLTPDAEIYSIPMQYGLTLTGRGTQFTFDIPNWQLAANTTYALVGRSTDSNPVKWGNIQLGAADYPPQPQNGFTFSSTQAFATSQAAPTIWIDAGAATNNAVEVKFLFVPSLSITNSPQTYSGSAIAAAVTCSSGGAISNVQYNGSGTVPSAAGAYAVTANCAANGNYSAVTGASAGNFVINAATQATLVVVPNPSSINVNGTSTLSTTGGSGSGAVAYNLVSGPCTLSGATLTGTGAGSCIVTATKAADSNYTSTTSSQVMVTVSGPPPVTNLVATPGPGYITLTFTIPNTPAVASLLQPRTLTTYTGTCTSTNGGVTASKTGTSSPLIVTGTTAGKSYSCVVTGSDGSGTSSPATSNVVTPTEPPAPAPIPTLSEWAKIMMMFLMIATVGWYGRRLKQR